MAGEQQDELALGAAAVDGAAAPAAGAVVADAAAPAPAPVVAADMPTLLEQAGNDLPTPAAPEIAADPAAAKPEATEGKPDAKAGEKPLAAADKPADKPAEKPAEKPADAVADAEPTIVEAALAPIDYKIEWPETIKADDPRVNEFMDVLQAARVPADLAPKFVALHESAMRDYADKLMRDQQQTFIDTRRGWQKDIMADPEIGGAGHQTAMNAAARVRDLIVPKEDREAFNQFLRVTGAGDNPAFVRMLHRAARFIDEPQAEHIPSNIRPTPNNGRAPGRRAVLYDHPTSNKAS